MLARKIILVMLCTALVACNGNTDQSDEEENSRGHSMNQPKRDITEIENEVLIGNIESYKELKIVYLDYSRENFLFWALLMANKYDYPPAYLDVFYVLVDCFVGDVNNFYEMDRRTQELSLEYLKIASEKGMKEADEILLKVKR